MHGSFVLLVGIVRVMERESKCEVLARQLDAGSVRYSMATVLKVDSDLPDGSYKVVFDGHFVEARKMRHLWITDGPVTRVGTMNP